MNLTAEEIIQPEMGTGDFIDVGTTYLINSVVDFVWETYHDLAMWLMPMASQTTVKNMTNSGLASIISKRSCPVPKPENHEKDYVDFQREKMVVQVLKLLHDQLAKNTTVVNDLIERATESQSGTAGERAERSGAERGGGLRKTRNIYEPLQTNIIYINLLNSFSHLLRSAAGERAERSGGGG